MHSYLICTQEFKKKNNCNKNKTQWRFKEEVLKKFEQITKDSTIFNNSFTQLSNSINFQKQYDHGKRNSILYDILVLKNINRKRAHNIYQQELTHSLKLKKNKAKYQGKGKVRE